MRWSTFTSGRTARAVRRVLLALCLLVGAQTTGLASSAPVGLRPPSVYVIEGYLDRAPKGVRILDRFDVHARGRHHTVLVTRFGSPGGTRLGRRLSRSMGSSFALGGTPEEVERLANAQPGTRVSGTFAAYTESVPWLLIVDLTVPAPRS